MLRHKGSLAGELCHAMRAVAMLLCVARAGGQCAADKIKKEDQDKSQDDSCPVGMPLRPPCSFDFLFVCVRACPAVTAVTGARCPPAASRQATATLPLATQTRHLQAMAARRSLPPCLYLPRVGFLASPNVISISFLCCLCLCLSVTREP